MIAIINYGLGNLHSVQKAAAYVGCKAVVTDDVHVILSADKIILPGVGAFADGMKGLESRGLLQVIQEAVLLKKPLLGICLGMQLLFEMSEENEQHRGLGLIAGNVVFFKHTGIKVPQIGWNQIKINKQSSLLNGIQNGEYFYFNHSYYCMPEKNGDVLTTTDYGVRFSSSFESGSIFGVQFHPEKSQKAGLRILKNFMEL